MSSSSHSKQTLELRGEKKVNIHTSTQNKRWATLAVTVCENGTTLPPMLIFKDKKHGRMKSFQLFQLAVHTIIRRMHRWMGVPSMSGLKKFTNHSLQQHQEILVHSLC